jgi:hypothetical protein
MTEMAAEIAVDYDEGDGVRGYIEIGVEDTDDCADLHIEDGENPQAIELRLSAGELRSLIASLEKALDVVEANS